MTVPSAAVVDGQVPSAYIALKIYDDVTRLWGIIIMGTHTALAVLRVAKLVPTTEMRPVPR